MIPGEASPRLGASPARGPVGWWSDDFRRRWEACASAISAGRAYETNALAGFAQNALLSFLQKDMDRKGGLPVLQKPSPRSSQRTEQAELVAGMESFLEIPQHLGAW